KARDIEAEAMSKVDVQFYPPADEFPQMVKSFTEQQKINPNMQPTGAPGAGQPGGPAGSMAPSAVPVAPAPATGHK
ncbi:MAG TPA: hypothetical protein VGM23_07330, partial [Armatimonadota bacterium]